MSQLTVRSNPDMGPLEVSVYPPDGDPTEFTLSSGLNSMTVPVQPGRHTVVARRPNGARLRRAVEIGRADQTVDLATDVGETANEFMHPETQRGLITPKPPAPPAPPPSRASGRPLARPRTSRVWRPDLLGAGGAALASATLGAALSGLPKLDGLADMGRIVGIDPFAILKARLQTAKRQTMTLALWTCREGGWSAATDDRGMSHTLSGDFLKVSIPGLDMPAALGLTDDEGLGPIVRLPPFRDGMELTFIAKGVATWAADRTENPGGDRTPVALVTPRNPSAADMLAALAAPATPPAADLWEQTATGLAPGDGPALEMLMEKFDRPAEAMLAAHYLLRFLPGRLPLRWADNLVRAMPLAADGPVIAAWARILAPPENATADQIDAEVDRLITLALARPAVLYARTRQLLFDALALSETASVAAARPKQAEYRRFGAGAGGLEAFWGTGPAQPGRQNAGAAPGRPLAQLNLIDGLFVDERPEPDPLQEAYA